MSLADECAARVHDRARQAAARIIDREEAMTAQDAAQGEDCEHLTCALQRRVQEVAG